MTEQLKKILNDLPYSIRHSGEIEELKEFAKEQAERVEELESKINAYNETIRNLDVLADSVNYASIEHKPTTEYIADEINRNISELEKKVGEIR